MSKAEPTWPLAWPMPVGPGKLLEVQSDELVAMGSMVNQVGLRPGAATAAFRALTTSSALM